MGFLMFVELTARVVVGCGDADCRLLDGQGAVGLSTKHVFEQSSTCRSR